MNSRNQKSTLAAITESSTVNEVVSVLPATLEVFGELGIDTCCGGGATLQAAAQNVGMLPDELISRLESHVQTAPAARYLRHHSCDCHV